MKDKTYSTSETVLILRQALGTFRAWDDCLADMRRDKTSVCGFILKPACRLHDGIAWRPVYAWQDIKTFIRDVFSAAPEARVRLPVNDATSQRGMHSFNSIGRRDKWRKVRAESKHIGADHELQDAVKGALRRLTV